MPTLRTLPSSAVETTDCPAEENAILAAIAQGHRGVRIPDPEPEAAAGVHRAALVLETIAEILATGKFHGNVPAYGGVAASEWTTDQRGSVRFLSNPTDQPLDGGAFPAPAQCTLAPREVRPWLHDFPIGPSGNYLGAYAGLVKSDAPVLHAAIRPDPHPGALVVVYGTPGTTAETVLFHTGHGTPVTVAFGPEPLVATVDSCLVVALPTQLAGELTPQPDGSLQCHPWVIQPDGKRLQWRRTRLEARTPLSFQIDPAPAALRLDTVPVNPGDFDVETGSHTLDLLVDTDSTEVPLLIQSGACSVTELNRWEPVPPPSPSIGTTPIDDQPTP
ncbi:MAG: hypothetical protein ACOVT5_16475, partial [Armatimonadaceae bacterium]